MCVWIWWIVVGNPPPPSNMVYLWSEDEIAKMKNSAQFARITLDFAMDLVEGSYPNICITHDVYDMVSGRRECLGMRSTRKCTPSSSIMGEKPPFHHQSLQTSQTLSWSRFYPSPLNYMTFPKSVCISVNEICCHGIPDTWETNLWMMMVDGNRRRFEEGDVVKIDVSVFDGTFHGDNCSTSSYWSWWISCLWM